MIWNYRIAVENGEYGIVEAYYDDDLVGTTELLVVGSSLEDLRSKIEKAFTLDILHS